MDDKELEKLNKQKEELSKLIEKVYNTVSLTQETTATEDIVSIIKKMDKEGMLEYASNLDVFGKCIFYYKMPIEFRLDVDFINATRVNEEDRLNYWKEYKVKLHDRNLNKEEEYNKIIMMACILHVPIKEKEETEEIKVDNKD